MELRVLNIDANSTEVIYAGVSATLEFNLNNDLDELKSIKVGDQIQFNLPSSFITLEDASLSLNSANWKAIEINPTKSYFFIECTQSYDWNSSNPIVFQMSGVKNKSDKQPPQNGDVTTKSQAIFFGSGPSQQLSLNKPPIVGKPDLFNALDLSLEDDGEIYVGNNLSNKLTINFKNIGPNPLFNGTTWPAGPGPDELGPMVSVFFKIVEDGDSSIGALTDTTNGFKIKADPSDSQLAWNTKNPENTDDLTWELTPANLEIIGTGTEANVSFEFSDIIPLEEGHTQMYVQFTGFPSDDTTFYNDHTFVLDILKKPAEVDIEIIPSMSVPNPLFRIQVYPVTSIKKVNFHVNSSDPIPLNSFFEDTNNNGVAVLEFDYAKLRDKASVDLPELSAYDENLFELYTEMENGVSAIISKVTKEGFYLPQGQSINLANETINYDNGAYIGGTLNIGGTVIIECLDFTLTSSGSIDGSCSGYLGQHGPGSGAYSEGYGGAGHVGVGGNSGGPNKNNGGHPYDSIISPLLAGSGGGGSENTPKGGAGGAALKLNASGKVELNGLINCSGGDGNDGSNFGSGGGSGGSIWIIGKEVFGNATLNVNGGKGGEGWYTYQFGLGGGGGAGGVIRIQSADTRNFICTKELMGGDGGEGLKNGRPAGPTQKGEKGENGQYLEGI